MITTRRSVIEEKDGFIEKHTRDNTEIELYYCLGMPTNFICIANCYAARYHDHLSGATLIKEKIEENLEIPINILSLCREWDWYAASTYSLFDYIELYLKSNKRHKFQEEYAVSKFIDQIHKDFFLAFKQLVDLVNELNHYGIYNVDWHQNQFGLKNGHLALFELGGAKLR